MDPIREGEAFKALRKELAGLGLSPEAEEEIVGRVRALLDDAPAALQITPVCPRCDHEMVLRTARRGRNTGNQFWGCVNYPRCREVQEV